MRAGRLVSIVLLLQNEGKMTSQQLAERLEVSERTILRDMEELSAAGVPVYAERGQQGGWLLTEGYRTSLTGMNADELAALLVASHAEPLRDLGRQKTLQNALQKLLAASTDAARAGAAAVRRKLHIDGAGWYRAKDPLSGQEAPLLPVIQEAVWAERRLKLTYMREGEPTERLVDPLGLVAKRNVWYLVARNGEGELRTFRIARLLKAEPTETPFELPADFDLAAYWETSLAEFRERLPRYPAKVRLRADAERSFAAERYVELLGTRPAEKKGWLEADVAFETLESACRIVLGYGAGIEAVEPVELRRRVMDEMQSATMLY